MDNWKRVTSSHVCLVSGRLCSSVSFFLVYVPKVEKVRAEPWQLHVSKDVKGPHSSLNTEYPCEEPHVLIDFWIMDSLGFAYKLID